MVLETNHARLYTVTLELARAGKQRVDGGLASSDSAAAAKVERERSRVQVVQQQDEGRGEA